MTIGFIYSGSSYATPDKGLSRQTKHAVNVSKFGDGYEQRVAKGINSQGETYNLQFNNRTAEFVDDVVVFLDAQKGITKFPLILPDSNQSSNPSGPAGVGEKEIKVVADTYTTTYLYGTFYSLTVSVRRVYEA